MIPLGLALLAVGWLALGLLYLAIIVGGGPR